MGLPTAVDNIFPVQVVDRIQNLLDGLRGVLLRELALLADPVEQLAACGQLGDDVVLVLDEGPCQLRTFSISGTPATYSRLEPVDKLDNVRVLESLQHLQLVKHHALVAADVLLQDDLDGDAAVGAIGLPDDAIGARAQGAPEPVLGPRSQQQVSTTCSVGVAKGGAGTYFLS